MDTYKTKRLNKQTTIITSVYGAKVAKVERLDRTYTIRKSKDAFHVKRVSARREDPFIKHTRVSFEEIAAAKHTTPDRIKALKWNDQINDPVYTFLPEWIITCFAS